MTAAQEHWSKFPQIPCLKVIIVSLLFYTNTANRSINQYFFSQIHEWEPQVGGYSKAGESIVGFRYDLIIFLAFGLAEVRDMFS